MIAQPASVFVVEDEALIAMELRDRLSSLGYTVRGTASRGEQAIELIAGDPPDVVLMDIRLAGKLTGIETAARLRERADVPVIFLSAYSDAELLRQAGNVEPYGYLVKPFEERELNATIQMALYKHRMERALRESHAMLERKVAERTAELAASRETLAVTLNSIGEAVLATDAQGRITGMNPTAEQLTGWAENEAVGRPVEDVLRIVDERSGNPERMPVEAVLAGGQKVSLADHIALVRRDGARIGIAESAAPMRNAAGETVGAALVFRDETESRARRTLIARQGTMLGALRRVQEQFINSPDAATPFEDMLSVLLYSTGSDYGFIGEALYTADGNPYLEVQAISHPDWTEGRRQIFAAPASQSLDLSDIATLFGALIRNGQPIIAAKPDADPGRTAGGLPLAAFFGAPISVGGYIVGMIGVARREGAYEERILAEIQPLLATYGSLILARRNALRRRNAEDSLRELNANLESEVRRRTAAQMESERRYGDLLAKISDGIIRSNAEGRLVYANRRFLEWFGFENRSLGSIAIEDYVAPEWRRALREQHERRMRGEQVPDRFEYEAVGAQGQRLWLDTFVTTIVENGRIVGSQSVIRDVTQRKQAEEALLESRQRLRELTENMRDMLCRIDRDGRFVYVSPSTRTTLGYAPEELIGQEALARVHPEDMAAVAETLLRVFQQGEPQRIDCRYRRADGHYIWIDSVCSAIRDESGAVTDVVVTSRDVTEQRQMDRALRVLSTELVSLEGDAFFELMVERLATLLDCEIAVVGSIKADENGPLQTQAHFENGRIMAKMSSRGEGAPGMQVMREGRSIVIESGASERYPASWYLAEQRIDGYAAVPLTNRSGNTLGFLAVMSTRPLANPARTEAILQLFGTSALAEIEQQRRSLQASRTQRLEAIGTLAGGIAHDLNNALTPILMMIDLLKEDYPGESETLETVERSANHAAEMVRRLLAFAKGTEGQRTSLQPLRLVEDMEKIAKGTFPKNIDVRMRAPKELPTVLGDSTQLHQVLLNLCVNARDAMPDGGTLTLEAGVVDASQAYIGASAVGQPIAERYVVLRVTDTGVGIPPQVVERIFDPFFTTKDPERGTGLGLFTVAGIVKGHGGSIHVSSRPNEGTTFSVYLPAEGGARAPEASGKPGAEFFGNGETILYVDDEGSVREAAKAVLSRLNFTPLVAADGSSALDQALQYRPILRAAITDLHMPRMDGLQFVRALRKILPDLPVIIASGRLDGHLALEFKRLGVHVVLDKPFTQDMLAEALREALTRVPPA